MKTKELCGKVISYPLGLISFSVSFLRNARTFHPSGIVVQCEVENEVNIPFSFHLNALARFSGALWKRQESWKDTLGIALRFSREKVIGPYSLPDDQYLLFASFKHAYETPISPLLTHSSSFGKNEYFAIAPFLISDKKYFFKLNFLNYIADNSSRSQELRKNIKNHTVMMIRFREEADPEWRMAARIRLLREMSFNQEELAFNPFLNGCSIVPVGFIHSLRTFVYPMSQFGRGLRHRFQKILHKEDNRLIIKRF